MTTVNILQHSGSNYLQQSFIHPNPYKWLDVNRFEPDVPDNDPITDEEMVSVMISLAQLERGEYIEVPAGSDDSELQKFLDDLKK